MDQLKTHRSYVSYIDRSREYYAAQGYTRPYAWPHYDDVPFTPLQKPLAACRVGLVTTAGRPQAGGSGFLLAARELYAEKAEPAPEPFARDELGGAACAASRGHGHHHDARPVDEDAEGDREDGGFVKVHLDSAGARCTPVTMASAGPGTHTLSICDTMA